MAAFGEYLVKPGLVEPRYGRILHNAFEARLDSDYAPNPDLNEDTARQLIDSAEDFCRCMNELLAARHANDEADHAVE